MTLTPIVAETAMASATIATPVRESPDAMPATAMRAEVPPSLPAKGAARFDAKRTNSGTQSAKPRISRNTAASPATRFVPEVRINSTALAITAMPVNATVGSARRAPRSSAERVRASRG